MYVCMYVCMYVFMCVCVCVCVCVYTYTHTYTHTYIYNIHTWYTYICPSKLTIYIKCHYIERFWECIFTGWYRRLLRIYIKCHYIEHFWEHIFTGWYRTLLSSQNIYQVSLCRRLLRMYIHRLTSLQPTRNSQKFRNSQKVSAPSTSTK